MTCPKSADGRHEPCTVHNICHTFNCKHCNQNIDIADVEAQAFEKGESSGHSKDYHEQIIKEATLKLLDELEKWTNTNALCCVVIEGDDDTTCGLAEKKVNNWIAAERKKSGGRIKV